MGFEFLSSFENSSSTVAGVLGEPITEAPHKAVAYDTEGTITLARSGEKAFGVLVATTETECAAGDDVTVLIRNIGLVSTGADVATGDLVTIDANGSAVPATEGAYIFGRAYTTVTAGALVQVDIFPSGTIKQGESAKTDDKGE